MCINIVESLVSLGLKALESFQDKTGYKLEAELLFLTNNQFGHSYYKVSAYGFVHQYGYSILNSLSAFSLK